MVLPRQTNLILAGVIVAVLPGCGESGPDKVVVSGKVTYRGQPVRNGDVLFYPIEGTPGPVSGGSIKDGQYLADGKGGVPVGKHRVEIRAYRSATAIALKDGDRAERQGGQREQYLPARFNSNSTLIVRVGVGSASTHDFDLTE